jgi:hypothetical protein
MPDTTYTPPSGSLTDDPFGRPVPGYDAWSTPIDGPPQPPLPPPEPAPHTPPTSFDPLVLVRDRPWLSVGVAAAVGFGLGLILGGRPKAKVAPVMGQPPADAEEESGPTFFETLIGGIGSELAEVGKQAVEELKAAVAERAQTAVSGLTDLVGGIGEVAAPNSTPPA